MTELEELIPRGHRPLKRVRNVAAESVSDALISDRPKRSRSRTPILLQDSFESEGFLMQIDEIEKNYTGSRDKVHDFPQFDIPSFDLGVSQEEKEEDNDTFIDRSLMRIMECDLQISDVQTPTNTDKGKYVLVEAPKRRRMRPAQWITSALQAG
ncbi:hypothetical protein Cgig2_005923 [Carnegiea gigantea]|uniref:Uncharacterized protein n=1 Tax=Carnegiea gigantea TaxID=171969 RepID=A0A9Q1JW08_9CARY|nr:hypothetical protein Cgig2_005923 [Carnegiea gigantea]